MKNSKRIDSHILEYIRQNTPFGRANFTDEEIDAKSNRQLLDHWLQWQGIIGYTNSIISTIENIYGIKLPDVKK